MSHEEKMDPIIPTYFRWHYGKGTKEFFGVVANFLWFINNFFSLRLFSKTLFDPLGDRTFLYPITAALGFLVRVVSIGVGLVAFLLVILVSFAAFIIWVLAPAVILGSLVLSVTFFAI